MTFMKSADFYTLRQVADLTGLTEFTLRGWEGRYDAFTPSRSTTGRRQYSKTDLKRAFLLRELTRQGHRIGDIAPLTTVGLSKKLDKQDISATSAVPEKQNKIEAILKLALIQDWDGLKKSLYHQIEKKTAVAAIRDVILPVLACQNVYVANNKMGIAQEHILSALIKEQLYILLSKASRAPHKFKKASIVIATPEGDFHELGILVAHVILNSMGVKSLYLGPNSPKNELCETVIRFGATHVLLATTLSQRQGVRGDVFSYLHYIDQHLPPSVDLWIGGRNVDRLKVDLKRNLTFLKTLQELPDSIQNNFKVNEEK